MNATPDETPKPFVDQAMRTRTRTALLLAPIGIASIIFLPPLWFGLLIGGLFGIGLWEWSRLSGWESTWQRVLLVSAQLCLMAWLALDGEAGLKQAMLVGVVFWLFAPFWLKHYDFARLPKRRYLTLKTMAGALAVIPAFAATLYLDGYSVNGPYWVLFLFVLIWVADSGAYFSGKRFGREKLAPHISPGKTREGAYGAFVACMIYSGITAAAMEMAWKQGLLFVLLAVVTVAFSIIGDLFESLIKRHSQVKDSGDLFPGHGGVFDRFDSLFAAAPVFVFGKTLLSL